MTKLEILYAQKAKKLDQLCAVAARELGLGDLAALSGRDRIRVDDQVEQYVEQWEETVEMRTGLTIRPVTPLRRLLAEYQDICERISTSTTSMPDFGPIGRTSRSAGVRHRYRFAARPGAPAANAPGLPRSRGTFRRLLAGPRYFWSIHSPHQAALKVSGHSELAVGPRILCVVDHDDLRRITLALSHCGDAVMLLPVEAFSALGVQRSGYIRLHCAFSLHCPTAL